MDSLPRRTVTVRTKRDLATFESAPGERLLFAGLRQGLDLPYECASGVCGTCQALAINASKRAFENLYPGARAGANLAPGRVLMCQTACCEDVELRLFSRFARMSESEARPGYAIGSIAGIEELAPNTIAFSIETNEPLAYRAGQFFMLSVDGVNGYRAYSMTGAPGARRLDFVVRTLPGGGFSEWLRTRARPRGSVRIFGPLGRATLEPGDPKNLFAIAGGTGVAGIMSILEQALATGYLRDHRATLVFGVKSMAETFFLDRLSSMVEASAGQLEVVVAISGADGPGASTPGTNIGFTSGLVVGVAEELMSKRSNHADTRHFIAGPPIVVESGIAMLHENFKVDRGSIRFDRFQ